MESKPILDNVDKMLGFAPNLDRLMSISPNALSGWATLMGSLALPCAATATLEQSGRQAPRSVHVDGRIDQAGDPANR